MNAFIHEETNRGIKKEDNITRKTTTSDLKGGKDRDKVKREEVSKGTKRKSHRLKKGA